MRRVLLFCLFLLPVFVFAQNSSRHVLHLSADTLRQTMELEVGWLFKPGDDSAWAAKEYNDSGWVTVLTNMTKKNLEGTRFDSAGWFRFHLYTDSTLKNQPIALMMDQVGASEIYIDGKLVEEYGRISNNNDSIIYYNPQNEPYITHLDTGYHVIAVRYVNRFAREMFDSYDQAEAGFDMRIGAANSAVAEYIGLIGTVSVLLLTLSTLFFTLSAVHFLLWLYHRVDRSNLYFSIFCISLSIAFLLPYILVTTNNPKMELYGTYTAIVVAAVSCLSLSGLTNHLFSKKKTRFYIIAAICVLPLIVAIFNVGQSAQMLILPLLVVVIESIVLTISAIYRKIKGARIVGVGVLFFALFIFILLLLSLLASGVTIKGDTTTGALILLTAIAAILSIPLSMSIFLARNFATMNKDLNLQLVQIQELSEKTLQQEQEKQRLLENRKEELEREVALRTEELAKQHEELKEEKHKSDELLRNILPEEVAEELKTKGSTEARYFDHVTVMFTDFVDFTKAGERMTPQQLVDELDTCFKAFDRIISKYNIEKIKTIGDAYLAVSGLPMPDDKHAEKVAGAALEIMAYMKQRKIDYPDCTFEIRIGLHSGPVVAGIVGVKKFAYDIWGDTVNTAARMEQSSLPGRINISQTTYELINAQFNCTSRGEIEAKNKGELSMYFIEEQ